MDTEDPNDLPGFSIENVDIDYEDDEPGKKGKKKKSGGFQAMGLSMPILKAIFKMGYKVPTPIQRKTIPLIMEGRDVVAMAKTGSGKTGCFLIPLFEKLKQREIKNGARALILTPTRELAIQTFKFIKQLGKFTDLKTILVLGGDSMDSQFAAIHTLPDIIVATPGRFLHLCVEMDMKLSSVQYCVFDEADRLFEMGFGEQLTESIRRLPESRQMVLFSATLPKQMVDFAKAGLSDPTLLRLDVESKIPETLDLKFIYCRPDERYATLLVLMREVIPKNSQIVLFAGTQHHVELISLMLTRAGIANTFVYSGLDASARKINTAKFTMKKVNVLVVTDIVARGMDIPTLDYVVNVHFPGKPKLFVHRVGRCARAGRSGTAFNIFSNDDIAHMIDLHMFLSRPLQASDARCIGRAPPELVEAEHHIVLDYVKHIDLATAYRVSNNAYKQYIVTRPAASSSSNKKAKRFKIGELKVLEDFGKAMEEENEQKKVEKQKKKQKKVVEAKKTPAVDPEQFRNSFLSQMKNYRPQTTIFELNPKSNSKELLVMTGKREQDTIKIAKHKRRLAEQELEEQKKSSANLEEQENEYPIAVEENGKRKKNKPSKDEEHYISYQSKDHIEEDGYAINSFAKDAGSAEFSVIGDTVEDQRFHQKLQKWDRKKKKMVNVADPKAGKIRTEHGVWIAASYKTGRYDKWKERTKVDEQSTRQQQDSDGSDAEDAAPVQKRDYPHTHWGRHNAKVDRKKVQDVGLKSADQIVKQRMQKETKLAKEKVSRLKNIARKKKALGKKMGKAKGKK